MSDQANCDLSGRWTGIFNYPADLPPNGFEASLQDLGGAIRGNVSEVDDDPCGTGAILHSILEGRRQGDDVTFSKIYDDAERMPEPVFYSGTIQPDGNEISGRWEISGQWSGTFLMVRSPGAAETAETEAAEAVPVGDETFPPQR